MLALLLALLAGAGLAPSSAHAQSPLTEHTLSLDDGAPRPAATVADAAWLRGRWVGQGLGAAAEEVWLPPAGGAMPGVFRLVRGGAVAFYEMVALVEEEGSLVLRLKHFHPDLVGWEEKNDVVAFPLVRRDADTLWFDGLTMRRVGPDRLRVWAALGTRGSDELREALFEYRRARE